MEEDIIMKLKTQTPPVLFLDQFQESNKPLSGTKKLLRLDDIVDLRTQDGYLIGNFSGFEINGVSTRRVVHLSTKAPILSYKDGIDWRVNCAIGVPEIKKYLKDNDSPWTVGEDRVIAWIGNQGEDMQIVEFPYILKKNKI